LSSDESSDLQALLMPEEGLEPPRHAGYDSGLFWLYIWEKLRQAISYVRRLRLSLGPDSYFAYKRERKHERKQADRDRWGAKDSAEREREEAEREREYDERYEREREGDVARERTERAEGMGPDR
jgi:hypothetical protein